MRVCVCVSFSLYTICEMGSLCEYMRMYVCVYKLRGLTLPNSRLEVLAPATRDAFWDWPWQRF